LTGGDGRLPRHLGLADAAAVYAGIILGSGIFVAPAAIAGWAPMRGAAAALWLAGGVVAACGACCYAECASRFPSNGGFFVFHREAFGPAVAFVSGWTAILVTYPASIAAIALVFATYLGQALGFAGGERMAAAGCLAAAGLLNAVGLRTGPRAQVALTAAKLGALAVVAVAALTAGGAATGAAPHPPAGTAGAPVGWITALMILLWTYDGWSDVTLVAGEIKEPARNIGRAVLLGTAGLVAVYALTQLAVMTVLPAGRAAASTRPVADAVEAVWGGAAGRGVAALVVLSTFGSVAGTVFAVARLGNAMARGGAFFSSLAPLHPRWGTPARATAALTAAAIVYVFVASFGDILALFTFSVWIFYGATAVAMLLLRRRGAGETAAWRAPGGPIVAAVVLGVGLFVTIELVAADPWRAAAGAALLAAGFPAYAVIARSGARRR
jgi:APA family basic amino acid/polyamine antiporter